MTSSWKSYCTCAYTTYEAVSSNTIQCGHLYSLNCNEKTFCCDFDRTIECETDTNWYYLAAYNNLSNDRWVMALKWMASYRVGRGTGTDTGWWYFLPSRWPNGFYIKHSVLLYARGVILPLVNGIFTGLYLTRYDLVTLYGDIDFDQHWLR